MECYACDNEATRQCRRCHRVYCELHGGDLCGECLSPASSLPSFNLYRGSLLALLIGTAIAIWLLVQPPGSGDSQEVVITEFTPTVVAVDDGPTRTPAPTEAATPDGDTPTPRPQATATPAEGPQTYVVQDGDTLITIAEQFASAGVDPFAYAQQIADANGIAIDDPINPGQTLILP